MGRKREISTTKLHDFPLRVNNLLKTVEKMKSKGR